MSDAFLYDHNMQGAIHDEMQTTGVNPKTVLERHQDGFIAEEEGARAMDYMEGYFRPPPPQAGHLANPGDRVKMAETLILPDNADARSAIPYLQARGGSELKFAQKVIDDGHVQASGRIVQPNNGRLLYHGAVANHTVAKNLMEPQVTTFRGRQQLPLLERFHPTADTLNNLGSRKGWWYPLFPGFSYRGSDPIHTSNIDHVHPSRMKGFLEAQKNNYDPIDLGNQADFEQDLAALYAEHTIFDGLKEIDAAPGVVPTGKSFANISAEMDQRTDKDRDEEIAASFVIEKGTGGYPGVRQTAPVPIE